MNPIERLRDELAERLPDIAAEIDAPAEESGTWHLDVQPGGDRPWVAVEWRPDRGFGVSTPGPDDYGTKPDELYPNMKAALDRVVQLIQTGGRTSPPTAVQLAELRMLRGFSQPELAERAGMKQSNLSRIETRDDVKISTLFRIVAAMGGASSVLVKFPDGKSFEVRIGRRVPVEAPKIAAPAKRFRMPFLTPKSSSARSSSKPKRRVK
jgi:transcriptional regulator with XRE-family HTH domain